MTQISEIVMTPRMELRSETSGTGYAFVLVNLAFEEQTYSNTLTLEHRRYSGLRAEVEQKYLMALDRPLGEFLIELKQESDDFYRKFLNEYGDDTYSIFRIVDKPILNKRGIYAYSVAGCLKYIGRCRDSMQKRVNQGYGKIHPKNCYIDGQATNCHINALVTSSKEDIQLWFCELELAAIEEAERALIIKYQPFWNIHRG